MYKLRYTPRTHAEKIALWKTPLLREAFLKEWDTQAVNLMTRDGKDPLYENGGDNIKGDPLLTAAIIEIRDGYYALLMEQSYWRRQAHDYEQKKINQPLVSTEINRNLKKTNDALEHHNSQSTFRLQQPDYGVSAERKAMILENAEEAEVIPIGLPYEDAIRLLGTIIRCTKDTFNVIATPYVNHSVPKHVFQPKPANMELYEAPPQKDPAPLTAKQIKLNTWREKWKRDSAELTNGVIR